LCCSDGPGGYGLPEKAGGATRRSGDAGDAGADGGGHALPGAAVQRVCGHHQVAPLGHLAAAGQRSADADSRQVGRSREGESDHDGDRSAAPDGRGRSARATERQKKALYDYNSLEIERQRKLFEAGVTSRDAYDQAQQSHDNAKADYESAAGLRKTQEEQLAYYTIRAPFDGVVGDIPVHVGDYVSPATMLTTVDEYKDLEAYIYVPTERSGQVRLGLDVELMDNQGKLLEKSKIDFLSPQVDSSLQGILVKAPVHATPEILRNAQMVKARVIWSTTPMAVIPVLAVTRQGGQSFVFVARQQNGRFAAIQTPVTLGDTVGNTYSVSSGLNVGDRVIVSSTQFLVNGMPVLPLPGA
jgi:RND family efflux transporter MFP subunit